MTHPTPTPDDLAKIAGKLSQAQRRAVLWPMDDNHPQWANHISCWGDRAVADGLFRLRLTEAPSTLVRLTPLGLALRKYLESMK